MSQPTESDIAFQAYLDSGGKLNLLREWVRVEVRAAIAEAAGKVPVLAEHAPPVAASAKSALK